MNPKIVTKACLGKILQNLRKTGKRVVFTNGCFDLIHAGHVKYLQKAKKFGDVLILGLNTDNSVRRLKGKGRPIISQADRAEVLAGLQCIDYVVLFGEITPAKIIKYVKPDVLVKGADYKIKDIVGNDTVRRRGGRVKTVTMVKGKSTSSIIKKIRNG